MARMTRKVTLEISADDFRRLERHCSKRGISKQSFLLRLAAPHLARLAKQEAAEIAKRN